MAIGDVLNAKFDVNTDYIFDITLTDDDPNETPLDISTWSFNFKLINSGGATIWNIINADFTRPSTGTITFTKTQAQVAALVDGIYSYQLLVTKTGALNDVYMSGYYEK